MKKHKMVSTYVHYCPLCDEWISDDNVNYCGFCDTHFCPDEDQGKQPYIDEWFCRECNDH